jgi:hypothetical protein
MIYVPDDLDVPRQDGNRMHKTKKLVRAGSYQRLTRMPPDEDED